MGESRCEACKRLGHPCGDQAFAAEIRHREAQQSSERASAHPHSDTAAPPMARVSSQSSTWSPYELQPGMELPRLSEIVRRLELACPSEDVFEINQRTQRLLERLNPGSTLLVSEATDRRTPALNPYSIESLLNPYVPDPRARTRRTTEPSRPRSSSGYRLHFHSQITNS